MFALVSVFIQLLLCLSSVDAGRIGAFRFRAFNNFGTHVFEPYDPLALRYDHSYIGKLTYFNGTMQSMQSPRATKLQKILDRLPYSDKAIADGQWVVHMVVKQHSAATEDIETSDLNSADHTSGGASLQTHHKKINCTDDAAHEVLEFEISEHTAAHMSMPDLLDEECVSTTWKDRQSWTQNPYSLTEKTTAADCADGQLPEAYLYRDLKATFTADQSTRTERRPEAECLENGDEEVLSFTAEASPEVFTEQYVLEEECNDNADASEILYAFNADERWVKSSRDNAVSVGSVVVDTAAQLPFFKNRTTTSSASVSSFSGTASHSLGQSISKKSTLAQERNSKEPAFTVTAWVKGFGQIMKIASGIGDLCGRMSAFSIDSGGQLRNDWGCSDTHASALRTTTTEWTHVAFRYDGYGKRSVVVGSQEEVDVQHDTSEDYFVDTGGLVSATTHNAVIVRYNELGDVTGNFEGYSMRDCYEKAVAFDHLYFNINNGVCQSSASKSGSGSIYRRSVQYMITEADFTGQVLHGPFSGQLDEVLVYDRYLSLETIVQIGAQLMMPDRFNGTSRIDHPLTGMSVGTKRSWTRYADFSEDDVKRSDCYDSSDERYAKAIEHETYSYSGEGRGYGERISYTSHSGALENVSSLSVTDSLTLCNQEHFDTKLVYHSYQETTHDQCMAQQVDEGACLGAGGMLPSTRNECAGTFYPARSYAWQPDNYELLYDVSEDDCTVGGDAWGQTQPLLFGAQGRNLNVFSDHELTFYWRNKVGGETQVVNRTDLHSMKEWCRGTISCAGLQLDGAVIYPVEAVLAPQNDTAHGYRSCDERFRRPIESAMQCFLHAASATGPEGLIYISGDEFRAFTWGYEGSETGTACYEDAAVFKWTNTQVGTRLCSDEPSDYEFLPFEQSRWQRDNDSITSTKEDDCTLHKLDWRGHDYVYETRGTGTRPHFVLRGQKSWQREPVDCLFASDATFAINKSTARECRDEAILWGATGYSFQRVGSEFLYLTARHFTHPEEARAECQRLHANRDGPENAWDLCTNAQWNCAADDSCITSDTPDDTIFAVAACCFNTGTSCAITTDTDTCTPKHGYESFSFRACADEQIENTTNTTYNVYDPVWARSEWRAETRSRTYDAAYYDIVEEDRCGHGMHLSYDECLTEKAKPTYAALTWLGEVYSKERIAGCAVEGTDMYYNAYRYDSAKRPAASDVALCKRTFEHFTETFDYNNTKCRYLNHELEVDKASLLECQNYADQTGYTAFSFSDGRCLLAKDRGPCEEDALWDSRFFVSPEAVEQFQTNTNKEFSVVPVLECAENVTSAPRVLQVPWGPESYGVAWQLPVNATSYTSEAEAKAACLSDCPAIYEDASGSYWALDRLEGDEMTPTDPSYALHRHRLRNVDNFDNRRLVTIFPSASKEDCHAECLMETTCRMVQYAYGQCMFFESIYETLATDKLSYVLYEEVKGAVSYGPSGDCWLYKNKPGQRFSDASDGDCRSILTTGSGYKTFPVDQRLAGENKVVYILTEPDLSQAALASNTVHEERSEAWCDDRDGQGAWTAYPAVVSEKEHDDCSGAWTRNAAIERHNILQRECELSDSKASSWTRNSDAVTATKGKGGYALNYQNGYALRLGVGCGTLDLEETDKVYGQACLNATVCSEADRGHGYAVIDGACFSYLHEAGGNASDCRWERSIANASSFLPLVRSNFPDSVEACNARATCEGICERLEAGARAFVLATSSVPATPTCHAGWAGEDCTTLLPSYNTDDSITDKRHSAIDYCERQGQRLCPKQTPFPMGNLLVQIAPQSACVHYEAQTECTVEDYSAIEAVASCCGRTEKSGKMLVEAVVYDRVKNIGPCSYPKGLSGSMVVDSTAKLVDAYTVQQIAKALCAGGDVASGDCEAACLADSSCNYFSNTSATCTLHSACTQLTDHFDDTAATFRLRRKAGLFDKPQQRHELIGDCKYHATVRAAAVIDQATFEEAIDELVPWRCERGSVVLDRNISFLRHSLNESFKYDVMEEHSVDDNTSISLSYEEVRYTDSVHDTLEGCLDSNEGLVNAYEAVSKRCRTFQDPASALRTEAAFLGQSFHSAGLFEEFRMATDEPFEVLQSRTDVLPVVDWSLSSAADECEAFCLQNDCDGYVLSGQDCKLVSMPNSTMLAYMRAVEAAGTVIVRLRTASEFVCRPNASAWQITQFEAASMPPLALTELLGTASTLQYCKQLFFGDRRTPRLDVFLYDPSTGECRVSLLRDTLVASEGASTVAGFSAYRIAVAAMNPRRTEATKYETEDIARETCLPPEGMLAGRDCLSHECAPFWFREEDVIRHEITRDACNPTLPPELPLLSFAWDMNRQGTLTFNVEEDTCRASQKFLSWRTGTEGRERIVVESEAECLNKATANLTAVFLGNEPLPDHRSACNGIVDEHSFERLFPHAIQMAHSESTRIVSTQASIDECAAHANAYYAHQNRSTESKVFEYRFTDLQCAIFSEIECPALCLPDETAKQGFFAFRLHGETGLTAASCWLLSVLDSQSTGNAYCRQCPLGKHSARAGSNCLPCQQGRYADEEGLRACKSCPEGTFQFGSGETHCHNCPAGSYQDIGEGKRSCKLCAAGKYEQNNTCHDCPAGTAAPNNFESNNAGDLVYSGANYKGPLLYYDPRFDYSDVHGISYKEADGTYMKGYSPIFTALRKLQMDQHDSAADCISCTAGTYADQTGASECKACAEGQFNAAVGATGCTECDIGKVARPSDASFHDLMPFACFSAEELGEYKSYNSATDAYDKTGEDIGLIREEAQSHLEDCFESCKAEQACLFVSYNASMCRLHRKCDERGEAGWTAYRMSRSTSSISDSTAYALSVEATVYGPSHHECEEEMLLLSPDTYVHFPDHGITTTGTIATASTFQDAIDKCNTMSDCVGFTYAGAEDVSLRVFSTDSPILLKNQGDKFEQNGLQAWFKEQPVETKADCQQQCAQLTNCTFMEWNGTKACRKWSSCTPVKKASLEAPESSLYQIDLSASHRLFPFQGRWPCDAVVFGGKTKEECEAEAVATTAPMFYFDDGACHVYVSYTSNGIDDLYSGLATRQSSICLSGSAPPAFESATGFLYSLGKRTWDEAAVQCSFCPAGLHTEVVAATVCRQCQAGTYDKNPRSSNPCEACELGRFQDEPGQATCKACSAGRYADEAGGEQCKASGQGYRTTGSIVQGLQSLTSGPLQNNTHAEAVNLVFEGATGREICGRNSYAAGYENIHCTNVPVGSVSVRRERVWTKESTACIYDNSSVTRYVEVRTDLNFFEGDLYNRNGLHSLDDCIAFANEQSNAATADAVAASFENDFCHFYSLTTDGLVPTCTPSLEHASASMTVSEAAYGSDSDDPKIDEDWFREWTPHQSVRMVSPFQCKGLRYAYIGDYFSATDCINMCRMQEKINKPTCRYISYSSVDSKCYFVNWKAGLTAVDGLFRGTESDNSIFENTVANIEIPCSYGSRSISRESGMAGVCTSADSSGCGLGGYRFEDYFSLTNENFLYQKADTEYSFQESLSKHIGQIMDIKGMRDKDASLSTGNGGYYKVGSEWYSDSNCDESPNSNNGDLPSTFGNFKDPCRYKRKRFYDRIKAVLLQEHSIESNMFPQYLLAEGYSGDNLLNNLGFYDFQDYQSTEGLKMTYKIKNHIKYDSDSIRPLFEVSTNDNNFHSIDESSGPFRAKKGANSYEYCSGSTTQRYAVNMPKSCEEVGFPFVANLELSTGSYLRVCTKMDLDSNNVLTAVSPSVSPSVHCCIGVNCPTDDPTMPLCSAFSEGNYLDTLSYDSVGLYVDGSVFLTTHSETDAATGMAYIKDRCNQLGDNCLGVSQEGETFRTHGQEATLSTDDQFDALQMKTVNFIPQEGLLFTGGLQASAGIDTIFSCYLLCTRTRFCKDFFFNITSRQCYVQDRLELPSGFATTDTMMFSLRLNKDDTSKAQFCTTCAIGRTASSAVNGAVGVCSECGLGEISSTDDLFVADIQTGKRGQETCRQCPVGMVYVAAMASCLECLKGFACASEGSQIGASTQCQEHEYSTSSLLEFVGEDISAKASLRCEACPAGKYNADKSGDYCIKCPNGFFSKGKGYCEPCPRGTYTLQSGSDQCFSIDGSSFISWPASTFSMKQSCATEDDCGSAGNRVCTATEDAFCQKCTDIRPGHRTWYTVGVGCTGDDCCKTQPCLAGTYSTNGCEGEGCCQACVSTCQAGQHSSGCGPNDGGGSTQNTQCVDCPVNTFTEVSASIVRTFTNVVGETSCAKGLGEPHLWDSSSWSRKTTILAQSQRMHGNSYTHSQMPARKEAPPDGRTYTTEAEFLTLYGSAADVADGVSCSASAYQCVPCRSVPAKTTFSGHNYGNTVSFYAMDEYEYEYGRKEQAAWSTAGETGQSKCQSWWYEWGSKTMSSIRSNADDYPKPSPSPSPSPSPTPDCFPSEAIVETPEGKKPIYALEIGDFALSHEGFSEVYLLGHADNKSVAEYLRLTTDNGTSIRLSKEHFIESNGRYVYAKDVKKGDRLAYGERVIGIEKEKAKGLWNPFTIAGTIVVDGVLASCHSDWFLESLPEWMRPSSALIPAIYQTVMIPARQIYRRNRAWVRRFTESFQGKAIGEHSLTDVLKKMWSSYGRENVSGDH